MMTFRKGTLRPVAQLFPSWMGTAPLLEICRLWRDASPAKTKRNTSDRSGGTQNRKQQNFQAAFRLPVNIQFWEATAGFGVGGYVRRDSADTSARTRCPCCFFSGGEYASYHPCCSHLHSPIGSTLLSEYRYNRKCESYGTIKYTSIARYRPKY